MFYYKRKLLSYSAAMLNQQRTEFESRVRQNISQTHSLFLPQK